ncbi:hypothetical protein I7I53_04131 [Histoplasma capsulatum var. duboisii H88]|uniref:Uncharacterized protein n=1 Tax=Ajellomyces capsulatus (strain H88) TaxID=544711 RepID=A0A8A1LRS6_AJEC8|nr:hypothetical protein I7I53_04131 [Histoplasma capsulatum var. duboisii H88]
MLTKQGQPSRMSSRCLLIAGSNRLSPLLPSPVALLCGLHPRPTRRWPKTLDSSISLKTRFAIVKVR